MATADLGTLRAKIDADIDDLIKGLGASEKELKGFSKAVPKLLKPVGMALTAIGAATMAGVVVSIKKFGDFEQSMKNVQAVSGATAQEYETLKDFAIEMGSQTAFTAKEAADGMYFLASAGFDAGQQMKTTAAVLDLASATQSELADTSSMVVSTLSAFGLEAEQSRRVADTFAGAIGGSQATLSKLAMSMPVVSATMNDMGFSVETTATALSLMYDKGVRARTAATGLRNTIKTLIAPTDEAVEAINDLGLEISDLDPRTHSLADIIETLEGTTFDTAASVAIFGKETDTLNMLVKTGSEKFREFENRLIDAGGAAAKMKDIQLEGLTGQITLMKSAIDGAAVTLGETFAPVVIKAANWVTDLVASFNNLDKGTKEMIAWGVAAGGALAAIGGPLLLIIPALPALAAGMASFAALAPVVATAAALGTTLKAIHDTLEVINMDKFEKEIKGVEEIVGGANKAIEMLEEAMKAAKEEGIDPATKSLKELGIDMNKFNAALDVDDWDKWGEATKTVGRALALTGQPMTLSGMLTDLGTALDESSTSVTAIWQPTMNAANAMEALQLSTEKGAKNIADLKTKLSDAPAYTEPLGPAIDSVAESMTKLATAADEAKEAEAARQLQLLETAQALESQTLLNTVILDLRKDEQTAATDTVEVLRGAHADKLQIMGIELEDTQAYLDDTIVAMELTDKQKETLATNSIIRDSLLAESTKAIAVGVTEDKKINFAHQMADYESHELNVGKINLDAEDDQRIHETNMKTIQGIAASDLELHALEREELWNDMHTSASDGFTAIENVWGGFTQLYEDVTGDKVSFEDTWLQDSGTWILDHITQLTDWYSDQKKLWDDVMDLWEAGKDTIHAVSKLINFVTPDGTGGGGGGTGISVGGVAGAGGAAAVSAAGAGGGIGAVASAVGSVVAPAIVVAASIAFANAAIRGMTAGQMGGTGITDLDTMITNALLEEAAQAPMGILSAAMQATIAEDVIMSPEGQALIEAELQRQATAEASWLAGAQQQQQQSAMAAAGVPQGEIDSEIVGLLRLIAENTSNPDTTITDDQIARAIMDIIAPHLEDAGFVYQ